MNTPRNRSGESLRDDRSRFRGDPQKLSAGYEVEGADVRETRCPGGPLLVHGATEVRDPDGELWPVERPVVALCRCRRSDRQPWCDGSHKVPRA